MAASLLPLPWNNTFRMVYRIWYTMRVENAPKPPPGSHGHFQARNQGKRIPAIFYRTEAGGEPVREWPKQSSPLDRKRIGEDIKTVEFGWPIGMPVCRPLGSGIYEVRTTLTGNRIARLLCYVDNKNRMVLLHGFIKKTRKTPPEDLELARGNKARHQRGLP